MLLRAVGVGFLLGVPRDEVVYFTYAADSEIADRSLRKTPRAPM